MVGIEKPKEVPHGLKTGNKLHVSILMLKEKEYSYSTLKRENSQKGGEANK